jgi:hypothetical protein
MTITIFSNTHEIYFKISIEDRQVFYGKNFQILFKIPHCKNTTRGTSFSVKTLAARKYNTEPIYRACTQYDFRENRHTFIFLELLCPYLPSPDNPEKSRETKNITLS